MLINQTFASELSTSEISLETEILRVNASFNEENKQMKFQSLDLSAILKQQWLSWPNTSLVVITMRQYKSIIGIMA